MNKYLPIKIIFRRVNKIRKEIINQTLKTTFVRNVFTVASGAAIAQLIGILFSPVITRLYGPETFGVLGVFVSITAIIAPIVALTYPMAIVLTRSDQEAKGIVSLSLIVSAIITVITALALTLFGEEILGILNMEILFPLLVYIPIFLYLSAVLQVAEQWFIRKKHFNIMAKASVIQTLLLNIGKVGIGFLNPIAMVLIVLTTFGQLLSVILLLLGVKMSSPMGNRKEKTLTKSKPSLMSLAKEHKDFPIYRTPEVFINGVTQSLPVLMLTTFFGPASAGFYLLGSRLLSMPASIIGKAVGDVFYPRIAEASHNKEKISTLVKKATYFLALIGIVPFGIIIVFGPWLFSFVFGSEWLVAGEYARWMALWTYFMFINNPSVRTLPVISEQKFQLLFTNISLIVRLGMLIIGAYVFKSDTVALALFSIAGAILNITLILLIFNKCNIYDEKNIEY